MRNKRFMRRTILVLAALSLMLLLCVGTCYAGAYAVKENRWNFHSNEVCGGDLVYAGEPEQQPGPWWGMTWEDYHLGQCGGDNGWIVTNNWDEFSTDLDDDEKYPRFSLISHYMMYCPTITFDHGIDESLLNNKINTIYGPYLFTEREYAVLNEGRDTTKNSTTPWNGNVYDMQVGNQGLKLWAPGQMEIGTQASNYAKFKDQHQTFHLESLVGDYRIPTRVFEKAKQEYTTSYGYTIYDDVQYLRAPKISDADGSLTGRETYLEWDVRLATPLLNVDDLPTGKYTYTSQSFDHIAVCCALENRRVVIRRQAGIEFSGTIGPDALQLVPKTENEQHRWKLTVIEDDRHFQITNVKKNGNSFTFTYSGAKTKQNTGDEEDISVIVEKGDQLWYGRIAEVSLERTATLNLPFEYTPDCKIWVINESNRGNWSTDFCSNVVQLLPPALISFNGNGGECTSEKQYAESYSRVGTLPTARRTGYVFTGWYENADGSGMKVTADSTLDAGFECTLYAGWVKCPTIVFDAAGGTVSPLTKVVNEYGKLTSLPTPTRSDYKFLGWYTAATGGTKVTTSKVYLKTTTLYAHWELAKPTALTGAKVTIAAQTYNGKAKTPAPTVKLNGKTLTKGTDYTVTYANNVNAGTAKVTIKGKDHYTGSITASFTIKPASIAGAAVTGIKASYRETVDPLKPVPTVKLAIGGKTVTLKSGTDYTVSYKNNSLPGTATITIKGKGNYTGTLTKNFKITAAPAEDRIDRLWGLNRYQTARAIADAYKKDLGVSKFSTIILADGYNFPDALAGAYFASVKNAPIVTINGAALKAADNPDTIAYIKNNLKAKGTVYILGGPGSVDESYVKTLRSAGFTVTRYWGNNRYLSNLSILKGANVKAGTDFLVCTGAEFGDALSASATGKPILLVGGVKLTEDQKAYLKSIKPKSFTIVGSTKEVPESIATELKAYAPVTRIGGATVYDRSIAVAKKYFPGTQRHINLASGRNHADGLCGGPLAVRRGGPLILTDDVASVYSKATAYAKAAGSFKATVYGGEGSLKDSTVKAILRIN
ncbi:MAG: cell wall-binding repeat-containing protein [Clostridia bacterium]|nr:cell wall-binding repeat-containing protein [Clostridia bacterium]